MESVEPLKGKIIYSPDFANKDTLGVFEIYFDGWLSLESTEKDVGGPGDVHKITLVKNGGHISLGVGGMTIIDRTDDNKRYGPVLGRSNMGWRQMKWIKARYRNFIVWEVSK